MPNCHYLLSISFLVLLTPLPSQGQSTAGRPSLLLPKVEYIGTGDGLPYRETNAIVQDKQGFFWLSNRLGVFRYDGYQFVPMRKVAKNGNLLPPAATRIYLAPDGSLLMVVKENLFFTYDAASNEIKPHPLHRLLGKRVLPMDYGLVIFENDRSILVEIQQNGKRYLVRCTDGERLTYLDSLPLIFTKYAAIHKDKDGNLFWSTCEGGIRRYDTNDVLRDSLISAPDFHFDKNKPFCLSESVLDGKQNLLYKDFVNNRLNRWDWKNRRVEPAGIDGGTMTLKAVSKGLDHTWFINDGQYLILMDSLNRLHDLTPFLKEKSDFSALINLIEDWQGQIWVTSDNGLFKLSAPGSSFNCYLTEPQPKWAKTTRGFFEDNNGAVYFRCENCGISADSAIYRIDERTGEALRAPFSCAGPIKDGLFTWTKNFIKPPGQNIAWTVGKFGIIKLDLENFTAGLIPGINSTLLNNSTSQVGWTMNRQGEIVAGGRLSQLFAYDPATQKMRSLLPGGVSEEQEGYIRVILETSDGILWVGLNRGLHLVEPLSGKILQSYGNQTHPAFLSEQVQTLFEDADGTLWVGTFGGGLVHVFPKTGRAVSFTTANGLPDNIIAAILPWKDDYLWVGTFNGLTCFNKKDKTFVNFYEEDGLSHNEFNISSAFIDSKGRYYFGGMNGINAFYPGEIMKPQKKPPPLLLTGFSFYDEKTDTLAEQLGGLQGLKRVTFSPHVSWFQFNYALPDFTNPKLNQFKTWLENFEKGWTYQGTTPFIRYNRLPAGSYTLHVKAADAKGYWSEHELTIRITVRQVFYKTWWFVLLLCLAAGAGLYAIVRFRYHQKLALEQMRTRIASDLHDEVGSSLSHLNFLVGSFDLENAPELTAKGIEKSKEIMQKTASDIRDVVWAIDARRDKTGDLLDRMEDFAFDLLGARNIAYHFSTNDVQREATLNPFVRQNIYLIFKEAINNIAKHSNASEVNISFSQKGDTLEVTVADNGTGGDGSKVKGQGLENMRLRAKRIGGDVAIGQGKEGFVVQLKVVLA